MQVQKRRGRRRLRRLQKVKKGIKRGNGFVNSLINKLPFEAHIPTYQYCGPGTKLQKRLARNDPGINGLDRACKQHDIAYSKTTDVTERNRADNILAAKAWDRFKSSDAGFGERVAALGVSGVMKAKSAMGAGLRIRRKKRGQPIRKKRQCGRPPPPTKSGLGMKKKKKKAKKQKSVSIPNALRLAMKSAKSQLKQRKPKSMADATAMALGAAKAAIRPLKISQNGGISNGLSRIIPVPKIGGIIPLIPVFAGLSALGALMGGSAGIASAVISANKAKKDLNEMKRHNQTVEAISLGKRGSGLYLKHYKKGYGLYLRQFNPKNKH